MEQLTPAQNHWRRVMAERRNTTDAQIDMTAYEQILHRLRHDQSQLSYIQSTEAKVKYKLSVLNQYEPWIDGVLNAQTGQADEVFTTLMVWMIDCGNYERALAMGAYVLQFNLALPEDYSRTPATLLIDEICDPTLIKFSAGLENQENTSLVTLTRLDEMTSSYDVPDAVRAKLYKTIAYTLRLSSEVEDKTKALSLLQSALMLNAHVGVKRDIENLQRELKKQSSEEQTPSPEKEQQKVIKVMETTRKKVTKTTAKKSAVTQKKS